MITQKSCKIRDDSECKKTAYEIFDSIDELVMSNKQRPHLRDDDHTNMDDDIESRSNWYQCSSYGEAEKLALNGWKGLLEKSEFTDFYRTQKGYTEKMFRTKNDVVGFAPIVPNVLKGIPQAMINVDKKRVKSKVIHIVYNITCPARCGGERIMQAGFKFMSAVVDLEKQGYRIRLTAMQEHSDREEGTDIMLIKVKSENKLLDIFSTMFTLTHTAVFRLLGFTWYEKSPIARSMSGYGMCYSDVYYSYKGLHEDLKAIIKDKNAVMINAYDIIKKNSDDKCTVEEIEEMILKYGRSYDIEKEADAEDAC